MMKEDSQLVRNPSHLARIYQACYHCLKPQSHGESLKRCSHCKRVCYDTVECQKANWKRHKQFCKAYATLQQGLMTLVPPPDEPTDDMMILAQRAMERTLGKLRALELILERPLGPSERSLISCQPRCLACARTEEDVRVNAGENAAFVRPLMPCRKCRLSFYCSEAHREFAQHTHENVPDSDSAAGLSQCAMNQIIRQDLVLRELVQMESAAPPLWLPDRVMPRWESLEGRSWASEYEHLLPAPPDAVGALLRNATDGLTFPLTILWALEKIHVDDAWTRKDTLNVHILGAADKEALQAVVFEEIMHRLPEVKTLKLVLCGPGMDFITDGDGRDIPVATCSRCTRSRRKHLHLHIAKTYHDYATSLGAAYTRPDLAIAFNSGVGHSATALWLPTVRLLVRKKVPTLFTAFNRDEVAMDRDALVGAGAQLIPGLVGPNPWGSQKFTLEPNRVNGYYTDNMFIAGGFR